MMTLVSTTIRNKCSDNDNTNDNDIDNNKDNESDNDSTSTITMLFRVTNFVRQGST